MFLFSYSNCPSAALRAGYCPPCLKSVILSVWLLLFLFLSRCPGKVIGALAQSTLVFTILSLSDIKASDVLMNFQSKADQQFTTNFIRRAHMHRNANRHTCTSSFTASQRSSKLRRFIRNSTYSHLLKSLHHTVSVSHTPGELNTVNVCTSSLLIDELFMLSKRSICVREETCRMASHHSKAIQIQMQQLKFVYGAVLCLRGGKAVFKGLQS